MGNQLQRFDFTEKLQVPENNQQEANVKRHQKYPQQGFVFADGGKQEGVMQRPQPPGFFLRIDLERGRMFGRTQDFDQTNRRADKKNGNSGVDHRHQYNIIERIQDDLPLKSDQTNPYQNQRG
jgi:hypothetical protein